VARYCISDVESLKRLESIRIDWHIIRFYLLNMSQVDTRSLSRSPSQHNVEREQALKLLRAFMDIPEGVAFLTLGIVKAIVALAEGEERLAAIAAETLAEIGNTDVSIAALIIAVLDTALVVQAGGLRALLQGLLDGPVDLSMALLYPFLYVSDFPSTRRFLYPDPPIRGPSVLGLVLSNLTNVMDPSKADLNDLAPVAEETIMRGNAKTIAKMMSTWAGLLALCARSGGELPLAEQGHYHQEVEQPPTFPGVRSMVDALRVKSLIVRDVLLDLWFEVLNIRIGSWAESFLAGRRLTGICLMRVANSLKYLDEH
jgi:rapamycin-insensitive companion of mTOR